MAMVSTLAQAKPIKLRPGAIPDRVVHTEKAPIDAFCEILSVVGRPPNIVVEFYNMTGTTGPDGGSPADKSAVIHV
jgi:hypothetical protein